MNALDKKGKRKIREKNVHKYFVELQKRWNPAYIEALETQKTQKEETQVTADKYNPKEED